MMVTKCYDIEITIDYWRTVLSYAKLVIKAVLEVVLSVDHPRVRVRGEIQIADPSCRRSV
jgi:hypothetical protein